MELNDYAVLPFSVTTQMGAPVIVDANRSVVARVDPPFNYKAHPEIKRSVKAVSAQMAASPEMLEALKKGNVKSWVANAGITNDIEALRRICLEYSNWWNTVAWPLIEKVEGHD